MSGLAMRFGGVGVLLVATDTVQLEAGTSGAEGVETLVAAVQRAIADTDMRAMKATRESISGMACVHPCPHSFAAYQPR